MLHRDRLTIDGMHCGGCVAAVNRALLRVGVEKRSVEIGSAEIEYDDSNVEISDILDAIRNAGFSPQQANLNEQ